MDKDLYTGYIITWNKNTAEDTIDPMANTPPHFFTNRWRKIRMPHVWSDNQGTRANLEASVRVSNLKRKEMTSGKFFIFRAVLQARTRN